MIVLQAMINAWATMRLTIYFVTRSIHTLVTGQQDYTIGTGGDFDQARPIWVQGVSIISNNNPSQPLELPIEVLSTQEWQLTVPIKRVFSALPTKVYYDNDFPLATFSYWPIPNVTTLQTVLYLPQALTGFAAIDTSYTFPPGYEEAIVYDLARRMAPEWQRPTNQDVVVLATESMARIKRANIRIQELVFDQALNHRRGTWDWRTGQYDN
jgi:hypothetical protein